MIREAATAQVVGPRRTHSARYGGGTAPSTASASGASASSGSSSSTSSVPSLERDEVHSVATQPGRLRRDDGIPAARARHSVDPRLAARLAVPAGRLGDLP